MKKKLLTVLVLTYNHGKFIKKSLNSIINQKHVEEFDIIVVDDKSNDETVDIIKSFKLKNLKLIINKKNEGHKRGTIKGYDKIYNISKKLKTKYLAIIEGDDVWEKKDKLKKQIKIINNDNNIGCICSDYIINDLNKKKIQYEKNKFHISTTLFTVKTLNKILSPYKKRYFIRPGDMMINILFKEYSKIYRIKENMVTTYIAKHNSEFNIPSIDKYKRNLKIIEYLSKFENFKKTKIEILYFQYNSLLKILKIEKNFLKILKLFAILFKIKFYKIYNLFYPN